MGIDKTIPFANPGLRFELFKNELNEAFQSVNSSNHYILGKQVDQFEASFSAYIGTKYCIGVNSATDGLALSLMALGIKPGDEVITAGLTAPATVTAILQCGATPVVVDVLDNTLCIDPAKIKKAINSKTKALIPVHLHGFACEMEEIMSIAQENNLKIIEDCSQAHGATVGNKKLGAIGHVGVFSFYPTKNLGCIGDGGAVTTDDETIAKKIKSLRNYGFEETGHVEEAGVNSRLDEIQAAILNMLLPHLDEYNNRRRKYASLYFEKLNEISLRMNKFKEEAVYHQFPVRLKNRDTFRDHLEKAGVLTGIHYQKAIIDHKAFKSYCHPTPIAAKAAKELVSLPIQPEILDLHFETIVSKIKLVLHQFN